MTSKEAIKTIKIKCHPNSNPTPLVNEALDFIEKQLEILEILKKNHISTHQLVFVNTPMKTIISFQANDEERKKIEGWLDNEK